LNSYYEILGVDPGCDLARIKSAFRKKAKEFHPDVDPTGRHLSSMRALISAYEILSDPEKRKQYDLLNAGRLRAYQFNYREFLRRRGDSESVAKLILFDLLHNREEEALELYDSRPDLSLDLYLDREDYMDCVFMLAEEYEKRTEYEKSYSLLRKIVVCEYERPYFHHFFREVVDRLRMLSCFEMPGNIANERLVRYLKELVEFDFSPKDSAFFLKKIAEIYAEDDAIDKATYYLNEGLKRHSKLPGIKKLRERLTVR
jgi:curved DNA-binding protein CbpA